MSVAEQVALTEAQAVYGNRYSEAIEAGMTEDDATEFAESSRDIGELRNLVRGKCPKDLLPKILL